MILDLSHPIFDGRGAYPGLPEPRVEAILDHDASRDRYEGKAEFFLGRIEMSCNTGTYLDAPFHRFRDGADLSRMPLERLVGLPGIVVDAPAPERALELDLAPEDVTRRAVLVRTGRDRDWPEPAYWEGGPHLGPGTLRALIEGGAALVGVDFANVDDTADPARPAHTGLLDAGIPIVENLRGLGSLPHTGFRFTAAPPAIVGGASFPVRAFAEI